MKSKTIEIGRETRSLTVWADQEGRGGGYVYVKTNPMSPLYDSGMTQRVWMTNLQIASLSSIIGAYINGITSKA